MAGKTSIAVLIIAVIVIIAAAAVLLSNKAPLTAQSGQAPAVTQGQSLASLSLTDPPQVPSGTTSLVINYSSLAVHTVAGAWITSNTSGSVDLLTLTNASQVLGNVNVSKGTIIDMARFYVSAVQITINGTAYNVTVPSGQVTAHLSTPSTVNGVTQVLVQLSPVVVTIFTNTTPEFVLVPSVRAIAIGNASAARPREGERTSLSARERDDLEAAAPNITITSASLSEVNGSTMLSITVKDNSNASVDLRHIGVRGAESVSVNAAAANQMADAIINRTEGILSHIENESQHSNSAARANASAHDNISTNGAANSSANGTINISARINSSVSAHVHDNNTQGQDSTQGSYSQGLYQVNLTAISGYEHEIGDLAGSANIHSFINASVMNGTVNTTAFGASVLHMVRDSLDTNLHGFEAFQQDNRILQFQIMANGTLALPFSEDQFSNGYGYNLSAGQSHTFTFSGPVTLANGRLDVALVPGSNYTVTVQGETGAMASTSVNATA